MTGIKCNNSDGDCFHKDKCREDGRCPWPTPAAADPQTGKEIFKPLASPPDEPVRVKVLQKAKDLTLGDRNKTYGDPYVNLSRSALLLNAYFGTSFNAADVSIINGLLKLGRLSASPLHEDHYVDMANYFGGMPYECQLEQLKEDEKNDK